MIKWYKEAKHHLRVETGWGYWYHLWHSIQNTWKLLVVAFKSLVHGLFPWVWKSDSPKAVIKMYHTIMRIEHIRKMDELKEVPKNERYRGKFTNITE